MRSPSECYRIERHRARHRPDDALRQIELSRSSAWFIGDSPSRSRGSSCPARVERRGLVLSAAALYALAYGSREEDAEALKRSLVKSAMRRNVWLLPPRRRECRSNIAPNRKHAPISR